MKKTLLIMGLLTLITSCNRLDDLAGDSDSESTPESFLVENEQNILPFNPLATVAGSVEIRNGGFGSAATAHPTNSLEFYAITDRGPNTDFLDGKKFPVSDYVPRIGHFAVTQEGNIELLDEILLRDPSGVTISGIPNPEGRGATGEIPYDINGNPLPFDDFGMDSEGLVALEDGTFWVSDEYGPHMVHYDANGTQIERISPIGVNDDTNDRQLPAVFASRRPNRGMEGLAITPDERTLVGIMQSTMHNPETIRSNVTRIVTFDLVTGVTQQYIYIQEANNLSNSEIVALSSTRFLVVERDGNFAGEEPAQKHVYEIDLSGASDISGDDPNSELGMLVNELTIEQNSAEELIAAGIVPVQKRLVADLVALTGYPHDKLEGFWLIDENTLGCLNDDDFSVIDTNDDGVIEQKVLPGTDEIDSSSLYLIKIN